MRFQSMVLKMEKKDDNLPCFDTSIIPHISPNANKVNKSEPSQENRVHLYFKLFVQHGRLFSSFELESLKSSLPQINLENDLRYYYLALTH